MNQQNNEISDNDKETLDYDLQSWDLEILKLLAAQQRAPHPRSLVWSITLYALPLSEDELKISLKTHRNFYEDMKKKLSMDPRSIADDDPLSQNDESAWNQHFCDNELKGIILQDVVRTYPDELYFRDKDVQDVMVRVLFYWARTHSHVGYRQGMHEILAPLLYELFLDRQCAPKGISETMELILDKDFLEHDSYMLFSTVMKGLERFYTTGDIVPTSSGRMPTCKVVHKPNEVVTYLDRLKEDHLVNLDPELAEHLSNCNVSLELFGIRWLRLLFGREFPRSDIPHLWGYLFSDGPTLPNVHFIVLAMLISMRDSLLGSSGAVLSRLMRPLSSGAAHVVQMARHLAAPRLHPRPPPQTHTQTEHCEDWTYLSSLEETGSNINMDDDAGSEGVAEGLDVSRDLATLAMVRARLPAAAAALAAAMPKPPPHIAQPLNQILQLASFLKCRNHTLIDVETALEAAEAQPTDKLGRRQLVPVSLIGGKTMSPKAVPKPIKAKLKEVQLKVFRHAENVTNISELPCLDPLHLRTE